MLKDGVVTHAQFGYGRYGQDPSEVGFGTAELDLYVGGDFAIVAFGKENAFGGLVDGNIRAKEPTTSVCDVGGREDEEQYEG